jgi:hypothetical protein
MAAAEKTPTTKTTPARKPKAQGATATFGPDPKSPPKGAAVGKALDLVVTAYGKLAPMEATITVSAAPGSPEPGVVDHALYVVLAKDQNPKKAAEAVQRLHSEFVDWNEVRLCEAFEFADLFADLLPGPDLFARCERLKELINQIYQDQNKISLEFLREASPEERAKYLATLPALRPEEVFYVQVALTGFDQVVFHYGSARVVQRLGVVKRTGSPTQMVAQLEKLLAKRDLLLDQVALVWLGEAICLSKSPNCKECCLVKVCVSRKV